MVLTLMNRNLGIKRSEDIEYQIFLNKLGGGRILVFEVNE
jgi:hypothetical protein